MNRNFNARFKKQVGIGLGYLLLIIVLVVAIGAAAMKFSSDSTPSTSGQQAQLDAGTFANQIGAMRGSLTMLATSTTTSWDVFGPTDGTTGTGPRRMTLAPGVTGALTPVPDLDTGRQVAMPPKGANNVLTWRYTIPAAAGAPIYMYTDLADVPSKVCQQFNGSAKGTVGDVVNATLAGTVTATTTTTGVVAVDPGATFITAAESAGDAGCYVTAANGNGRIVARLR